MNTEDLKSIPGIGPKTAENIVSKLQTFQKTDDQKKPESVASNVEGSESDNL